MYSRRNHVNLLRFRRSDGLVLSIRLVSFNVVEKEFIRNVNGYVE